MLHAIIVGIDHYQDQEIASLSYARADAEAFGQLLTECIDKQDRSVSLLLDEEATKRNIMVAIGEKLPRIAGPEDLILLYFACHGSPETEASPDEVSRYIVAYDTEYTSIYATGIDMERELVRWYSRIAESKLVLLFMDACFSGRAGGRTFEGPRLKRISPRLRGTSPIRLKTLELGEGRLMISACDDDQVATEDAELGHGVFTYHLLSVLKQQESDEPTISLNVAYDEILQRVSLHTGGRQTPIFSGRSRGARFPRLI